MQNITIKYNVDTASVREATTQLGRAKTATDNLQQSSTAATNKMTAEYKNVANNIAGLKMQMDRLKATIDLTNQTDIARLNTLKAKYNELADVMKKYQASVDAAGKQSQNFFSNVSTAVSIAGFTLLAKQVASTAIELTKLSGQVEGVRRAFNMLPNATALMAELREKTHGTLDELTLMQKAVQAKNFKIPLEQLGTLLEFAAVKAQQTGLDINYLTDSLITGLGRNSIKILDNLQFSVTELRAKTKELGSTQAAVFFLVNKQMKDMGGFVETNATKVDKMTAAWTNFKIAFSDTASAGGAVSFWTKFLDRWTEVLGGKHADVKRDLKLSLDVLNDPDLQKSFKQGQKLGLGEEGGQPGYFKVLKDLPALAKEAGVEIVKLTDGVRDMYAIKPQPVITILGGDDPKEDIGLLEKWNKELADNNEQLEKSTDVTGREHQELIAKNFELQRLVNLYSMSSAEFSKWLEDQDKAPVTMKKFREEIDKQIEAFQKLNAKDIKSPDAKGKLAGLVGPTQKTDDGQNDPATNLKTWYLEYATFWDKVAMGFEDMGHRIRKSGQMTTEDWRGYFRKLAQSATEATSNIITSDIGSILDAELTDYDARIDASKKFYETRIAQAGDNEAAIKQLRDQGAKETEKLEKERSEKAKKNALTGIIINTAANVIKSVLENGGIPFGLPFGAIAAAMGVTQYAIANRAKYAKGVIDLKGPGTSTSDSIPADLSKGESVMTANETRESKALLMSIRSGRINDRIIGDIIAKNGGSQAVDSQAIISELKKNRPQNFARIGSDIYEVKKLSENSKRYVRTRYVTR